MPSPALSKLEQLPLTPLSSAPASPTIKSQPPSRRGSSSASSFPSRRPSIPASGSALRPNANAGGSGASLSALTSSKPGNSSTTASASANTATKKSGEKEIQQAVDEEHAGLSMASSSSLSHPTGDSAIDDSSSDEEGEGKTKEALRTGNERLQAGSRRLSRMSSTLGEGVTAHWRRPEQPSSSTTQKSQNSTTTSDSTFKPPGSARKSAPASALPGPVKSILTPSSKASKLRAPLPPIEHAKRLAAYRAVDAHVKAHHRVIGIGSGSTVPYVVERILELGEEANRRRWFVPTGFQSKEVIVNAGLKLGDVDQFPKIDVTIDGADDVDIALNAIKGGGACHLREKVLAEAADEFVIVADYRKNNLLLGDSWTQGVPIETPPFAYSKVLNNLKRIPGCINPTLRMGKAKAGPLVTDNGNFVIDAPFDEAHMREPEALLGKIKMLTGVVECGLFCRMARAAYFGNADGKTVTVRWSDGQSETLQEGEEAKIKRESVDENVHLKDELLVVDLGREKEDESGTLEIQTVEDRGGQEELRRKLEQLRMTKT